MASLLRQFFGPALSLFLPSRYQVDPAGACSALTELSYSSFSSFFTDFDASVNLNANTTALSILNATYCDPVVVVEDGNDNTTTATTTDACAPSVEVGGPFCRVQFVVNTSSVSAIQAEAWLPTEWNGRLLALGNGGLGGHIDYDNLEYGTSLGFASVGSNNGHDGNTAAAFANNSEVLADFTSRSVHIETVVAKQLISAFYERPPKKSYYLGCSTGGRQGVYAALHHPSDFDGILAGAPATNFNGLLSWSGMCTKFLGAPYGNESASFIPWHMWDVITEEVLRQCDALDGLVDGIIAEPDACEFRPEELLCEGAKGTGKSKSKDCLTRVQVEALRKLYSPLYGLDGEIVMPRFDPGAESSPYTKPVMLAGKPFPYTDEWMKYVVAEGPNYDFSQFGLEDVARIQALDPGNISTFDGDLSAFRARGGKLITYHGRADGLIPSGNAKALYNLISRTLGIRPSTMDEFYRLFLVPGMGHCWGGKGAIRFGQSKNSRVDRKGEHKLDVNGKKEEGEKGTAGVEEKDGAQEQFTAPAKPTTEGADERGQEEEPTNILLALVDWVEKGRAPDVIVGASAEETGKHDGRARTRTRAHCRYPMRSRWDGERWVCTN